MKKIRLTDKKLEEVIKSVCGGGVLPLVKKLKGKENVSEFKLADQLKEDIKRVRNILYRLYEANLVEFTRKKDKKKGWYIYYWTFKPEQMKFLYGKIREERLERLRDKLERERKEPSFICPNKCVRLNFDQAADFEFSCPECGELCSQEDVNVRVEEIKKKIKEFEKGF